MTRTPNLFLVALAAVALALGSPARAEDTAKAPQTRPALELFEAMGGTTTAAAGADAMIGAMAASQPELAQYQDAIRAWYTKVFAGDEFANEMAALLEATYTEQEMRELMAFYKTPVGRKSLQVLPTVARESALIGSRLAERHTDELQSMIEEAMKARSAQPERKNGKAVKQ